MPSDDLQSSDGPQRFQFSPLDELAKEIRLVQIQPNTDPQASIRLQIKHVQLGDYWRDNYERYLHRGYDFLFYRPQQAPHVYEHEQLSVFPEYRALSYVWGAGKPVHEIYLDSLEHRGFVSVRQNLYDYLMIRMPKYKPTSWLWIDQLCIDQNNDAEKSHQVSSMAEIYVRATAVLVWLGPSFEGSDNAFDILQWVGTDERFDGDLNTVEYQSAVKELEGKTASNHLALKAITQLPYWSRLWIVQEVLLGSHVIIRLGDRVQDFRAEFQPAFSTLQDTRIIENEPCFALLLRWRRVCGWYDAYRLASSKHCSDVRDKAFGMLGLVDQEDRFYPDYSLDCQEILLKILQTKDNNVYKLYNRSKCVKAMLWYSLLDPQRETVDIKVVRQQLIRIHPKAREERLMTSGTPTGQRMVRKAITRSLGGTRG